MMSPSTRNALCIALIGVLLTVSHASPNNAALKSYGPNRLRLLPNILVLYPDPPPSSDDASPTPDMSSAIDIQQLVPDNQSLATAGDLLQLIARESDGNETDLVNRTYARQRYKDATLWFDEPRNGTSAGAVARCDNCPIASVDGCCYPAVLFQITKWLSSIDVAQPVKDNVKMGYYAELDPRRDLLQIPLEILRRLRPEAMRQFSSSQVRSIIVEYPDEIITVSKLLQSIRSDHFDVLITNLKMDARRAMAVDTSVIHDVPDERPTAMQKVVALSARHHWGPYKEWTSSELTVFATIWMPLLPCYSFYLFPEGALIGTVLPAAISVQRSLGACIKSALFTRLYQAHQLTNMDAWTSEKVINFANLLEGSPPTMLRTLPRQSLQNLQVLETLTGLSLNRAQVEAILSPLEGTTFSLEMLLAMAGRKRMASRNIEQFAKQNALIRYLPPSLALNAIIPPIYSDARIAKALKSVFCQQDSTRAHRVGYQVFWWYGGSGSKEKPIKQWTKAEIQQLGCLATYLAPLDMARFDLLEMAQDIENSYTQNFAGGDYSQVQAKILFNYGRQLLHLGSGSWTADRFTSIPVSVIPGIPIQKINEFPWEEVASAAVIETFKQAAATRLGFTPPQLMAILNKLYTLPPAATGSTSIAGIRAVLQNSELSTSAELMEYIPYVKMKDWQLVDFRGSSAPALTFAQARFWLRRSLSPTQTITTSDVRNQLFPFLQGLDCRLVREIELADIMPVLAHMFEIDYRAEPETARCLKDRMLTFLKTLTNPPVVAVSGNETLSAAEHDALMHTSSLQALLPAVAAVAGTAVNQQFTGSELRAMHRDTCLAVVDSASDVRAPRQLQLRVRPRARRESMIQASLSCLLGRQEVPGPVAALNDDAERGSGSSAGRIGLSEAAVLKYMLSELPAEMYFRVSDEVFYKNLPFIQGGCLSFGQRRAIRNRLLSTLGRPERWSSNDISATSCLIYTLEPSDFDQIPRTSLQDYVRLLGNCWDTSQSQTASFVRQCFQELGSHEVQSISERIGYINRQLALLAQRNVDEVQKAQLLEPSTLAPPPKKIPTEQQGVFHASDEHTFEEALRFRSSYTSQASLHSRSPSAAAAVATDWSDFSKLRMLKEPPEQSASLQLQTLNNGYFGGIRGPLTTSYGDAAPAGLNLTCDWFKAAGSHVSALATETFTFAGNMSSIEFIKCIPELANVDWSAPARLALWQRVKSEIGYPTSPELETMGYLLLALSDEELKQLDFSISLDLVWAFGRLDAWTPEQLKILAHRFRVTVTPVMSNLDAIQLVALGHILCGFSADSIGKINASVYLEASVSVGRLQTCTHAVLVALAEVATKPEAFGDVRYWDSATLSTIGIVAAGLAPGELALLAPMALNGLSCSAVTMMLPEQFRSMTSEHLQYLSMDAAMCVRREHTLRLTDAQRYAVWEAGSDVLRLTMRNTAAERASLLALIGTGMLTLLLANTSAV